MKRYYVNVISAAFHYGISRLFVIGLVLSVLGILGNSRVYAQAAACTDGEDCLCDTLPANDPNVIFCEDFEDQAFYELVPGHWVDNDPGRFLEDA